MTVPLSVLDLATVDRDRTVGDALAASVDLARAVEAAGYRRIWYAEHHNMGRIASSATAVLIAHIAANTATIRLGSGGVMLPNHSPLVIAEQFGTLAALHPGRIDLGLGRAPGTDQVTLRALRRSPAASDSFPQDVLELKAFLSDTSAVTGVEAVPGKGTRVPLYILGSSLFGASLAAALGLPYGFASHFAPEALQQAVALYRERFEPSDQLDRPHVIAALNVIAADDAADAEEQLVRSRRSRVAAFLGRGRDRRFTEEEVDALVQSPQGLSIIGMGRYTAVGDPATVRQYLDDFTAHADADELMLAFPSPSAEQRIRAAQLTAEAVAA